MEQEAASQEEITLSLIRYKFDALAPTYPITFMSSQNFHAIVDHPHVEIYVGEICLYDKGHNIYIPKYKTVLIQCIISSDTDGLAKNYHR